jgi:sn-glycerol 3-phosphate transport system ATP-binding protein
LRQVAEVTGLAAMLDRKPQQLSGGQRQRVALARAIIAQETRSASWTDRSRISTRSFATSMRTEIARLQQTAGDDRGLRRRTTRSEAIEHGRPQVILLREGRIEQEGTPGGARTPGPPPPSPRASSARPA